MPHRIEISRPVTWLATAAVVANVAATVPTLLLPDILTGPAVTNGSARGTALVMLVLAIPLLLVGAWLVRHGAWQGLVLGLGALIGWLAGKALRLVASR